MSSRGNPDGLAKDPANDLFWRYDLRRLSAEELRDSIYAVNGTLNLKMYRAEHLSRDPGRSAGKANRCRATAGEVVAAEEQARAQRLRPCEAVAIMPLLASFDFPETDTSCEARFTTTQPGQSFAMLNSKFVNEQAADLRGAAAEGSGRRSRMRRSSSPTGSPTSREATREGNRAGAESDREADEARHGHDPDRPCSSSACSC